MCEPVEYNLYSDHNIESISLGALEKWLVQLLIPKGGAQPGSDLLQREPSESLR